MKKLLIILVLLCVPVKTFAYQQQQWQSQVMGGSPSSSSNGETKFYSQTGSLNGYVKDKGQGQYVTYDKYHERTGRYQVMSDGRIKVYNRAGH